MSIVTKYKRSGVWYLRYGKRYGLPRKSLGTSDAKKAEAIRVNDEHRLLFSEHGIKSKTLTPVRYSAFVDAFLEYKQGQGRARNTIEAYQSALNNFGAFLIADKFVHEFTLDDVERFAASRREIPTPVEGRKKCRTTRASEKTIRNELITLVTAFKWARRQRYLNDSPADGLELPKRIKYPPRYLRREDYQALHAAIDDEEFRDIVDFYLLTGIRRGEGPVLRISEHVDLLQGTITVPQAKQNDFKQLPITSELRLVLQRLILRAAGRNQLIRYNEDTLTKRFRVYAAKAGLPKQITFHALRHTFGTWLAGQGVGFSTIQQLMGQRDPESTKLYVHAYSEDLKGALGRLTLPVN